MMRDETECFEISNAFVDIKCRRYLITAAWAYLKRTELFGQWMGDRLLNTKFALFFGMRRWSCLLLVDVK